MYPKNYFDLFPAFPRENNVFVAMSFAPQFQNRYNHVIKPAIEGLSHNGKPLKPHRVDAKKISDSILTEILSGIGTARYILADITIMGHIDGRPFRNDNVMYEVGIATAMRLPEEVILFRSDDVGLLFDVANMRVNDYSPDDAPKDAIRFIQEAIIDAGAEVNIKQHLAVKNAAEQIDEISYQILGECLTRGAALSVPKNLGQAAMATHRISAINKLLELGAISTKFQDLNEIQYDLSELKTLTTHHITEFGIELLRFIATQTGLFNKDGTENTKLVQELAKYNNVTTNKYQTE